MSKTPVNANAGVTDLPASQDTSPVRRDMRARDLVTGVVLAGGQARRMGGVDKGLVMVAEVPMAGWVVRGLKPQVCRVVINANRSTALYQQLADTVVADANADFRGPLAGMLAALTVVATPWIVSVPCDSPFVPESLVQRLFDAATTQGRLIAVAHDGQRLQPVFCLLHRDLITSLQAYLDGGGRKIDQWYADVGFVQVDFSDCDDAFINVNTPADRAAVETKMRDYHATNK